MLYTVTTEDGDDQHDIESTDVEAAAIEWASRVDPFGPAGEEGEMTVVVHPPDGAAIQVEITSELVVTYHALRLS